MRRSIALMPAMIMVSIAGLLLMPTLSQSRGGGGQVTVTPTADKVIAWSAVGGGVEESLQPGESVVTSGARGHTGFVQTSNRLLGFSSGLRQWRDVRLPTAPLSDSRPHQPAGAWISGDPRALDQHFPRPERNGVATARARTCGRRHHQRTGIGVLDLHRRVLRYRLDTAGTRVIGRWQSERHGRPHLVPHRHLQVAVHRMDRGAIASLHAPDHDLRRP